MIMQELKQAILDHVGPDKYMWYVWGWCGVDGG